MARLGLVAILLVALAPSVSRWLESGSPRYLDALAAMCTTDGLSWLDALHPDDTGKQPLPAGAMGGDYCAYCPLLASVTTVLLALTFLLPLPGRSIAPEGRAPPAHPAALLLGLGARGPPCLL